MKVPGLKSIYPAVIIGLVLVTSSLAGLFFVFTRTYDGVTLTRAVGGDISFDAALTLIILEHRMAALRVPEGDRRRLGKTLEGTPDRLEGAVEGDLRKLARTVLSTGADGRITDKELTDISVLIEVMTR